MPSQAMNRGFNRGRSNRDMDMMMNQANQMMQNMENMMQQQQQQQRLSPLTSGFNQLSLAPDPFGMDQFAQMDPFETQNPLALMNDFYDPMMGGGALTPFQRPMNLGAGFGGALSPFGRTQDVFRRDPFYQQTDKLMQDMLANARDQADNRRYQLEAKRSESDILEPGSDNKFSHQTYERLAGTGKDGKRYEREEKLLTDSDGTKRHTVKSSIDDSVKTSTWNIPPGKLEKDIPHMITYSDNAKKEEFEKCWHENMPFTSIPGVEGDVARLEGGANDSFEKIEGGGTEKIEGEKQGSSQKGRR